MNLKKYLLLGGVVLGMGMTSCVDDLDLEPNDPNLVSPSDPDFKTNSLSICYSGIAVSGISGPGSSYVQGLDPGTSAYLRCTYMLSEYPTEEVMFLWGDAFVPDLVVSTWGAENGIVAGAYNRFIGHIAICNQFLSNTEGAEDAETQEMRAQARVLRAYSYYNLLDNFGMSSFITEKAAVGEKPIQVQPDYLFTWLETELKEIVDNKLISDKPSYGHVGLDGAEALLARLYLNAEDFTGTARWADCQQRCANIIARHQGGGFQSSGLANHYLYLFARDNDAYMPGGSKPAENEILFGIAYDADNTQSYGGSTFVISSCLSDASNVIDRKEYGAMDGWKCFKGTKQMAEHFDGIPGDVRRSLWKAGIFTGTDDKGGEWTENHGDEFVGFTGDWNTCGGNIMIKFTGLNRNAAEDGGFDNKIQTQFATTDFPIIRLADIYLMWAECYVNGNVGDLTTALSYVNLIRARAGIPSVGASSLTKRFIVDERSRELYWEGTRRRDLIRNNYFTGPSQLIWQFKGSLTDANGTRIDDRYKYYPIPNSVISAQPEFKQNPGY